jgi:hypothetical protein
VLTLEGACLQEPMLHLSVRFCADPGRSPIVLVVHLNVLNMWIIFLRACPACAKIVVLHAESAQKIMSCMLSVTKKYVVHAQRVFRILNRFLSQVCILSLRNSYFPPHAEKYCSKSEGAL